MMLNIRPFSLALLLALAVPCSAEGQRMIAMTLIDADDPRARLLEPLARAVIAAGSVAAARYLLGHAAPDADTTALLEQLGRRLSEIRELDSAAIGQFAANDTDVPHIVSVRLATGPGPGLGIMLELTGEPPRITRLAGSRSPPPPAAERFASFQEMDRTLRQRVAQDRFSGVVMAARGSNVLFHQAYGTADRERDVPVTTSTRFNLGSGNKQFTAVAILRLAQEGRLDLDAPVGRYIRGLPNEVATQVTIRQLLQHRSGLGDYMRHPDFNSRRQHHWTTTELFELVRGEQLAFPPGTRRAYSNSGYIVLGAVIEAMTRRSYTDVIHEWVYRPAGMVNSGPAGPDQVRNTAIGYAERDGSIISNESFRPRPSSAGGGYSTAEDLLRFLRALASHELLQPEYTALMLNGFQVDTSASNSRTFTMGGGLGGISISMRADIDSGSVAIALANRNPPVAEALTTSIINLIATP